MKKQKDLKKQKRLQGATIGALALAIVFMAIGFAAYTQTLNINGTANVDLASWNVHFDSTKDPVTSSGSQTVTKTSYTGTTLAFSCSLTAPGQFCEFTIDVVNEGTFDAKLTKVTLSGISTAQAKYLTYKLYYNGATTPYTATTTVSNATTLAKKSGTTPGRHTVKARVDYIQPSSASDLPSSAVTVSPKAVLDFTQQ